MNCKVRCPNRPPNPQTEEREREREREREKEKPEQSLIHESDSYLAVAR